jgi:hypothetical protein
MPGSSRRMSRREILNQLGMAAVATAASPVIVRAQNGPSLLHR